MKRNLMIDRARVLAGATKAARPRAEIRGDVASLYLYDEIGYWGITAKSVAETLQGIDVPIIDLYINSPGGDVFDGIAIYNLFRRHGAEIRVTVDGLAASAASLIAMAGDTITMARGSEMMLHRAWSIVLGNGADLREMADLLDKHDLNLAGIYAARAGGNSAAWLDVMAAETWFTAEEALAAGLAEYVDSERPVEDVENRFDLTLFAHAGRRNAPPPVIPAALPAAHKTTGSSPDGSTTTREEPDMSDTLKAAICERLGVKAELDEDGVIAALDEALAEQADHHEEPEAITKEVAVKSAPEAGDTTVIVDKAALEQLQARAALADEAERQATAARRDQIVAQAKAEGRVTPVSEAKFRALLDKDEEAGVEIISALQPVANLTERGHAREQVETDTPAWSAVYPKENRHG